MREFKNPPFFSGIANGLRGLAVGLIAVGAVAVWAAPAAQATIIDNGYYTTDTASGLEWLDLTLTQGDSYNDVIGNVATNATYAATGWYNAGWQYATRAQVLEFWTNVTGFTDWDMGDDPDIENATNIVGGYVGINYTNSAGTYAIGYIAEDLTATTTYYAFVHDPSAAARACCDYSQTFYTAGKVATAYASWLVRSTVDVPEPGTIGLFALGLAGVGFMRRRITASASQSPT